MAKTRSQKGQQTEVEVSKVSEDKVKKSQKEKKAKAAPKEEVKESESSSDGPEAAGVQKQDVSFLIPAQSAFPLAQNS